MDMHHRSILQAIEAARELNERGDINREYARGQANLIVDLFGLIQGEHYLLVYYAITHVYSVPEFAVRLVSEYHGAGNEPPADLREAALR